MWNLLCGGYVLIILAFLNLNSFGEKNILVNNTVNNYSEFLNLGDKRLKFNKNNSESKIDILGELFKKNVDALKTSKQLDVVFLIDSSSSVGEYNFRSELKFVKKLLSDITVDYNHTRVAVISFSSPGNIIKNVDEISETSNENNKCLLLNKQLKGVPYKGGETFTIGAFQIAMDVFDASKRNSSKKVLFLITDGYSNGGDPVPLAEELKRQDVTIFTIGIENGNYKELYKLASSPGEFYSYLLDSFSEFESLARRALHVDLRSGEYIPIGFDKPCDILCEEGNCCDTNALCTCGTTTGHYACVCQPGYYGSGLKKSCLPCIPGTYSDGPNVCLPCPDVHHTTTPPAFGLESCKCKEGYRPTKSNGCTALKCPKILPPQHGYFVKKRECTNILNSACGIRCEVGYTLEGSSIRLCQLNATWSGSEPTCEVRTCTQLPTPKYGNVKCVHSDIGREYERNDKNLPVDTICNFECGRGTLLIGSAQRTCLPLARWDGLKTTCKQIKCSKLPLIKFGQIEPSSCMVGKQEFEKKCKIICNEGFNIVGPDEKICTGTRRGWDSKFEDTTCTDVTPPKIVCPENITITTLPRRKYGHVVWTAPNVTDNSGLPSSVWSIPAIQNISTFKFSIGDTPVTYFAQDAFHNRANCIFYITVVDKEPPTIENCINPPTFLADDPNGANITWEFPHIYDNSQNFKVNTSHEFGHFKIGTTPVTYNVTDDSGNKNMCQMNITVEETHCVYIQNPVHGISECTNQDDSIQCMITCDEGYAIPITDSNSADNETNFICSNADSVWVNQEEFIYPECTITKVPEEIIQSGEMELIPENNICDDSKKLEELENDIKVSLVNEFCIGSCSTSTKSECKDESMEERSNRILHRRDTNFTEVSHRNKKKNNRRINVKFQVRGKYISNVKKNSDIKLSNGYNVNVHYDKPKFICSIGFVPRKNRCVQCPKGTFHNVTRNRCQSCTFGYYNDELRQTECKSCPLNYSTGKMHSKRASDCKEKCPPGSFARKKHLKYSKHSPNITIETTTLSPHCRSCTIGFYQPNYGQLTCKPCPSGYTTTKVRSTNINDCIPSAEQICKSNKNICNNGTCTNFNDNVYQYTCKCLKNYVGTNCERFVDQCASQPCFNNGTCKYSIFGYECICDEGFTGKFCEETVSYCNISCLNNGSCIENDVNEFICVCPPGYGGDNCELNIKYCNERICENNGTCIEEQHTFKCNCLNGYIGRRCTVLPCDYMPCNDDNTICVNIKRDNVTKESYKCICPQGYTGRNCTEMINYCESSPCLNGGVCINNELTYSCRCHNLYYGYNCEHKRNTKYVLHFPRYNTNDYIKLNGFMQNVTEITACLWMQSVDNFNYGTLISYATNNVDNAFTLTDYTGLVVYVNNKYVVTDVLLNDGYWHHVCTTWQSIDGRYKVYVDGKIIKNGIGLSTNSNIQGGGSMVIGQEQDSVGGKFSQSESFIGRMAYIDVWSKALRDDDILVHYSDCNESMIGDLYAWPEMQNYINGGIQIKNSTFCNKCEVPKALFNGVIDLVNNVAYYSCYAGYELSNIKYIKGRKCTKASKWEGLEEPYCKKIYCGYPGYVKNANLIGSDYLFGDKVTYNCYDGLKMIGNNTIVCQKNGKWFPEKPHCLGIQCAAFKQPLNSQITILAEQISDDGENITEYDVGTQIEIKCNQDFALVGEHLLTCVGNGTWNFGVPQCKLKQKLELDSSKLICSIEQIPQAPHNGYIDLESLYSAGNGTTNFIEYKCRPGHKLHGDNMSTCIIDGYWTEPNISCDAVICVKPPLLKNMVLKHAALRTETYYLGNMLSFNCEDGYNMFGSSVIRCMPNGRWSRLQAKCLRKSCKKPNINGETVIQGKSFLYDDKITLICPSGLSYDLICSKSGKWEGEKDNSC